MISEHATGLRAVRPITAAETRGLRAAVLRPGQTPAELVYPGDDAARTLHLGAFRDAGLVGIASFYFEAQPSAPGRDAVRLRGMATLPAVRGEGFGTALMEAGIAWARAAGAERIWCNARRSARGFYEKLGLVVEGDVFEIPGIGPHYVMSQLFGADRG